MWRLLLIASLASCSSPSRFAEERPEGTPGVARPRAAAVECGLRSEDIQLRHDTDGSLSFVVLPSAIDAGYPALACFLKWAQSIQARAGFVSELPPRKQ
jgi:hypothetical protein